MFALEALEVLNEEKEAKLVVLDQSGLWLSTMWLQCSIRIVGYLLRSHVMVVRPFLWSGSVKRC